MASTSTSAAVNSDSDGNAFTDADTEEEEVDWVNTPYFPVEHVLEEYKSHDIKSMKEPVVQDPVHKKLSSSVIDSIKLNKMQFISLHTKIKSCPRRC